MRRGDSEGYENGLQQANSAADSASTVPGRTAGYADADNEEDSIAERGWSDGLAAGEAAAIQQAQQVDYPNGRKLVNEEHFAERIESTDSFSQTQKMLKSLLSTEFSSVAEVSKAKFSAKDFFSMSGLFAQLDIRHDGRCNTNELEQRAYQRGYKTGHDSAYQNSYDRAYREAYQNAHANAYRNGCRAAGGDAQEEYYRGYEVGKDAGYTAGYQRGYSDAFQTAYNNQYSESSRAAYDSNYQSAYQRYFELHRQSAYAERSGEIYQWNFNEAKSQRFDELYPNYAADALAKGRADEEQEFRDRPLRILGAQVQDSNNDGILEPNETLRLKLQLRNFDGLGIEGKDVRLVVAAVENKQANIKTAQQFLVKGLQRKSVTNVSDALEIQLLDAAVGKVTQLKLSVFNKGRLTGEVIINVTARHLTEIRLVGSTALTPGAINVLEVLVKNLSNLAITSPLLVQIGGDSSKIRVRKNILEMVALAPGQEQIVKFSLSVSKKIEPQKTAINVVVTQKKDKKRVGLLETLL
jgi:hypothetical protein